MPTFGHRMAGWITRSLSLLVILVSCLNCTCSQKLESWIEDSYESSGDLDSDLNVNSKEFDHSVDIGSGEAEGKQPNIVFIIADDLGWSDVGYHGSEIKTPYIDELATSGVRLDRYYVAPRCGPSRACLMSGRYQIHMGIQHDNFYVTKPQGLPLGVTTIAESLKEAGYSTHLIGKWHLGFHKSACLPTSRGFDNFFGIYCGTGHHFEHTRGFNGKPYLDLHRGTEPVRNKTGVYSAEMYTDEAISVIQNHNQTEKPLFMVVSHQIPHGPLLVPREYEDKYRHISNSARRKFAGMVSYLDNSVHKIQQALVETGQWENTILIFTTDNGGRARVGGYNSPLKGEKGGLWEGGVRGVGFVNSPLLDARQRGTEMKDLMHITDWFPTLVGVAGGDVEGLNLDGKNMWSAISEGSQGTRNEVLLNLDQRMPKLGERYDEGSFDSRMRAAIISGKWKLLTGNPGANKYFTPPSWERQNFNRPRRDLTKWKRQSRSEKKGKKLNRARSKKNLWLYDIESDPTESTDLSLVEIEVVKQLLEKLKEYESNSLAPIWPRTDPRANPARRGGVWGPYLDDEVTIFR